MLSDISTSSYVYHAKLILTWKFHDELKVAFKVSSFQNSLHYIIIFFSVPVSLFLLLMFYRRIPDQKAIPSSCWRTKISCLCGSLYAQHNHKVLIVLENKPKQIPELRGIFSVVGAQEALNTSSRWGAGCTGNCLGFDCNRGFERLEMLGKNNQTYGMH